MTCIDGLCSFNSGLFPLFASVSGDFEPLSNLMRNISPANPIVCQPITILGDDIDEENETFSVIISATSPDNITSPDTVTVTIIDDDGRLLTSCAHAQQG